MLLSAEAHRQRLRVEARPAACVAGHRDVGQEAHLDLLHALALALLAAAAGHVEGEAAGRVAAHARLAGGGEEAPDVVPDAHVGGRAGARRLADGGLVHLQHPADALPPLDGVAPVQQPRSRARLLRACGRLASRWRRLPYSTSRTSVLLPLPLTPVTQTSRCQRDDDVEVLQVVQARRR